VLKVSGSRSPSYNTLSSLYFHLHIFIAKSKFCVQNRAPLSVAIQSEIWSFTCRPLYCVHCYPITGRKLTFNPLGWKRQKCGSPRALQPGAHKPGYQTGWSSGDALDVYYEIVGLNLGLDTGHSEFFVVFLSSSIKFPNITAIRPWPLPSKYFPSLTFIIRHNTAVFKIPFTWHCQFIGGIACYMFRLIEPFSGNVYS
jgi:hypothetical protein